MLLTKTKKKIVKKLENVFLALLDYVSGAHDTFFEFFSSA